MSVDNEHISLIHLQIHDIIAIHRIMFYADYTLILYEITEGDW